MKRVSRREMLKGAALTGAAAVLAACATPPTATTVASQATNAPVIPAEPEGTLRAQILQGPPVEPVCEFLQTATQTKFPKIKVKFEYISGDRAEAAYTAAAAGTLADAFFSADLWVVPFAKQGVSMDLKPLTATDKEFDINDVYPSMLGLGTFDGKIHMLPSSLDVVTMYYNQTLFEKAGAETPKDTWTWDDLINNCKKITAMEKDENGQPKYWGLSHASNGVWNWWATYYPWIVGYGGKILDAGKSTWSDPKTIAGMQAYADLWLKHNIAQPIGMDLGGDSFRLGRAAIYTHIPGQRTGVRTDIGDKFKWDCQLMPKMPDGKHRTGMGAWGLSVYSKTKMADVAYYFVKTMVTPNMQRLMAKKEMATPLVKSVGSDPSWMDGLPTPPTNYAAFVKGADDAILPVVDYPADCGSFYAGELNANISTAIEAILRGTKKVEDAMKEIDAATQTCLDKNK